MSVSDHSGEIAWAAIGLGVAAYDVWAMNTSHETLTHVAHRQLERPGRKFLMIGIIGATALHLLDVMPRRYDVFYGFQDQG